MFYCELILILGTDQHKAWNDDLISRQFAEVNLCLPRSRSQILRLRLIVDRQRVTGCGLGFTEASGKFHYGMIARRSAN